MNSSEKQEKIRQAIAEFPDKFRLKNFPGDVFKFSEDASFVNDGGAVVLYSYIKIGETWKAWVKAFPDEFRHQIADLRIPISLAQLDKHNELCERFDARVYFPDGLRIVPAEKAKKIAAYYGSLYIVILPDGSSHT